MKNIKNVAIRRNAKLPTDECALEPGAVRDVPGCWILVSVSFSDSWNFIVGNSNSILPHAIGLWAEIRDFKYYFMHMFVFVLVANTECNELGGRTCTETRWTNVISFVGCWIFFFIGLWIMNGARASCDMLMNAIQFCAGYLSCRTLKNWIFMATEMIVYTPFNGLKIILKMLRKDDCRSSVSEFEVAFSQAALVNSEWRKSHSSAPSAEFSIPNCDDTSQFTRRQECNGMC